MKKLLITPTLSKLLALFACTLIRILMASYIEERRVFSHWLAGCEIPINH